MTCYRHGLQFFVRLANAGRSDLAATNAAIDGRLRLAALFNRRAGMAPRAAWHLACHEYRYARRYE